MKKTIVSFILGSTISVASFAGTTDATDASVIKEKLCISYYELAHTIMHVRQTGATLSSLLDTVNRHKYGVGTNSKKIHTSIINHAFARPRYYSEEFQQRAASEFADEVYIECIGSIKD